MLCAYCVFLSGEPFYLERDGSKVPFGFYRNEYVLTSSGEKAIAIAKERTLKKLHGKAVEMIAGMPFELKVEKLKESVPIWRIFRNEGFVFYPIEPQPKELD